MDRRRFLKIGARQAALRWSPHVKHKPAQPPRTVSLNAVDDTDANEEGVNVGGGHMGFQTLEPGKGYAVTPKAAPILGGRFNSR